MSKYKKVIVIGIDGADWKLLHPWLEQGHLPVLEKFCIQGTTGKLRSTIRPESSVAWSAFATGVNPGKHGVFGFVQHVQGSYQNHIANGSNIRIQRFWDILGDAGLRSCLINIPFTYPPTPINGILVGGMMTPGIHVPFVHPPDLQKEILARFPNYLFDAGDAAKERDTLIKHVTTYTEQQKELALWLLNEQDWDFASIVFTGPDRLQHFLWSDPQALLAHYQSLDVAIGEIVDGLAEPILVLLISDHGFNACAGRFHVNKWLASNDFLSRNSGYNWRFRLAPIFSKLKTIDWVRKLKQIILPHQGGGADLKIAAFANAIDWAHTRAYYDLDGGIRLNVVGREPEGVVMPSDYEDVRQILRDKLLEIVIPSTEMPLFSNVFMREELYSGNFVNDAPDIIIEPQRNIATHHFILDSSIDAEHLFASCLPYEANHAPDGILIASGTGIKSGNSIVGAQILDIAPTILAALGIQIPTYMDGQFLTELFVPATTPIPQYTHIDANHHTRTSIPMDIKSEQILAKRLGDLGYLD